MKTNNIKTLALGLALTCAIPAMAQNTTTIKGTVVDENGEPVIGASVRVPGTRQATVTDLDGNYSISAPKGTTLTVTYVGYKELSTKGGRIVLKEGDTDLNDVVVVGYGTQKKAHLTGSVESIPVDEIQDISSVTSPRRSPVSSPDSAYRAESRSRDRQRVLPSVLPTPLATSARPCSSRCSSSTAIFILTT